MNAVLVGLDRFNVIYQEQVVERETRSIVMERVRRVEERGFSVRVEDQGNYPNNYRTSIDICCMAEVHSVPCPVIRIGRRVSFSQSRFLRKLLAYIRCSIHWSQIFQVPCLSLAE